MLYLLTVTAVRCNPVMKEHDDQLTQRGKPRKVTLIAYALRKLGSLTAMVRDGSSGGRRRSAKGCFWPLRLDAQHGYYGSSTFRDTPVIWNPVEQ